MPNVNASPGSLHELQAHFATMVGELIFKAKDLGYQVTLGEAYRTPEQAALNAAKGIGISHSLHTDRLALDLNLFKDGKFLTQTPDYLPLGEWWEGKGGSWGGRFKMSDGNHFSLSPDGVRK